VRTLSGYLVSAAAKNTLNLLLRLPLRLLMPEPGLLPLRLHQRILGLLLLMPLTFQVPVMENEWVAIAGFSDDVRSQIAVERLLTNGVDAVAVDKRDSIYKIGEIEIFVHRDNVLIAKEIIKDL